MGSGMLISSLVVIFSPRLFVRVSEGSLYVLCVVEIAGQHRFVIVVWLVSVIQDILKAKRMKCSKVGLTVLLKATLGENGH